MNGTSKVTYYRKNYISGPTHVLVSLRFGEFSDEKPAVLFVNQKKHIKPTVFDVERYTQEVMQGLSDAN
ncbi:MAG: hypothetical protein AAF490_25465, partial [Chloroflexota bacterium]